MSATTFSKYLRIPLQSSVMLMIICFAALATLGERAGLIGLPLPLILISWFFKYTFVLIVHIVDGGPESPVLSTDMAGVFEQRPLCFLLPARSSPDCA